MVTNAHRPTEEDAELGTTEIKIRWYDNRGHHKYDNKYLLDNPNQLKWLGANPSTEMLHELQNSHNSAFNRLIYTNGRFEYLVECREEETAILLEGVYKQAGH